MKTQQEAKEFSELTLAFDHWSDGFKIGVKVPVISTRKDKNFKCGYRVKVKLGERTTNLSPAWFKELQ